MRSRSTVTPSGRLASFAPRDSTGSFTRIPVSRACRSSPTRRCRRSSSTRKRGPAAVFPELLQELRPRQRSLVAGELRPEGLHQRRRPGLRHAEEPFDIAPGEQGPVELLELADGVGDGQQPPGLRGHRRGPQRQVAAGPSGGEVNGFARATSVWMSTCRPTRRRPRLAGRASGSTSGPSAAVPGRVEASVSTTSAGAAEATSTATSPAARLAALRTRPGVPRPRQAFRGRTG